MWDRQIRSSAAEYLSREHDKPFLVIVSIHNSHDACELARSQTLPGGPIGDPLPPEKCPPTPAVLE